MARILVEHFEGNPEAEHGWVDVATPDVEPPPFPLIVAVPDVSMN